ncbi:MAG: hypothetical protein AAFY48_18080, partial [Bacteroidota bacterium]
MLLVVTCIHIVWPNTFEPNPICFLNICFRPRRQFDDGHIQILFIIGYELNFHLEYIVMGYYKFIVV